MNTYIIVPPDKDPEELRRQYVMAATEVQKLYERNKQIVELQSDNSRLKSELDDLKRKVTRRELRKQIRLLKKQLKDTQ